MRLQTCRRHPNAAPFVRTCSGCAQDCHDAQYGNPTNNGGAHSQRLADRVRAILGQYIEDTVRPDEGETPVRRLVWSIRELDELHARHGGIVTVRPVEGAVMEITVTVTLPGIAWPVEIYSDWDAAAELDGFALPVVKALNATA
ncbi:MAG: hypothetical protein HOW97_34175 [Catenulispora sp.]|nr:hypothetical protein [Catenulispora sp.]